MPIDRSKLVDRPPRTQPATTPALTLLPTPVRDMLMAIPGVTGVGQGLRGTIVVYASHPFTASLLPEQVDGHPIAVEVVGEIKAY